MAAGEVVLPAGAPVTGGAVGALVSAGYVEVPVRRRPRVAVLASGDELAAAGAFERVRAGRAIPDSNGPMLAAGAREAGAVPLGLGIARDDADSIREHVARAREADVLVTIGGASMGEADLFKRVLVEQGLEVDFWRVRIRPGSPVAFGSLPLGGRRLPVFSLPGNPASAFVTFQLLVRPFLAALGGHARVHAPSTSARAGARLETSPSLAHFLRVVLAWEDRGWTARPTGSQSSALVSSAARAHGLAVVPEGTAVVEAGGSVQVILLGGGASWSAVSPFTP